jgi:hypothetical protein
VEEDDEQPATNAGLTHNATAHAEAQTFWKNFMNDTPMKIISHTNNTQQYYLFFDQHSQRI